MKMTLNFFNFCDNWPESRRNQFSYDAKKAIFDYITELEDACGEETEFDPIAICCEWTEYDNALEAFKECNEAEADEELSDDEQEAEALKWLQYNTTVLELDNGGVVIQQF